MGLIPLHVYRNPRIASYTRVSHHEVEPFQLILLDQYCMLPLYCLSSLLNTSAKVAPVVVAESAE